MTSSPGFPQANGSAESAVKAVKEMLGQEDPFLALLSYRTTRIPELGASPAELLYGRQLRTTLPASPTTFLPRPVDYETVRERDRVWKERQRQNFNKTGVRELPDPNPGDSVLLKTSGKWKQQAKVLGKCAPRSFLVETKERRQLRRNRTHILGAQNIPESTFAQHRPPTPQPQPVVLPEHSNAQPVHPTPDQQTQSPARVVTSSPPSPA